MPGSSAVPALPPPDEWRDRSRRIVGRRDRRYSALLPGLGPRRRGPRRDAPLLAHRPRSLRQWRLVVCPACSIAWGWKSPIQPDGGEGLAKHKGVIARWRLKAVRSKTAT